MKPLSLQEIRQAVHGKPLTAVPINAPLVKSINTDGRQAAPGSVFVALRGERFDAHDFLPQAAVNGAIAAIVDHPIAVPPIGLHLIEVKDTRAALGKLAHFIRGFIKGKVIAVAGSNGKTSTKHLIDAALRGRLRGSISPKSFNNDIGVPLAIFPADPVQDYLVLEIGTNHPGEIKHLSDMAEPDVAVITNCGAEHLEFLGDLAGVRKENAAILSGLRPGGLLIHNGDDAELTALLSTRGGKRVSFGFEPHNDLYAADVRCDETGTRFRLNNSRREVFVPMLGRHAAANALAAIAVARRLGVPEDKAIEGLAQATGPEMRLQLSHVGGVTLINDAYNANPNSMRAALETATLIAANRRIAVIGDMLELGERTEQYDREIGQFAAECGFDVLACVGAQAERLAEGALAAGHQRDRLHCYADSAAAAADLPRMICDGDLVLVKGSRGVRLERVAEAVAARQADAGRRAAS